MARIFIPRRSALALSVSAVLMAGAAQADLTAADLWADWEGYLASAGYELTATQTQSGDTLNVTGITLDIEIPQEGTFRVALGDMAFIENGDGTVSIFVPETKPMRVSGTTPEEGDFNLEMEYTSNGFEMIASGEPQDLLYNYSAEVLGLAVTSFEVDGEAFDIGDLTVALENVVGVTEMQVGDPRYSIQRLTSDTLSYMVDITNPESGNTFFWQADLSGLDVMVNTSISVPMDMTDMAAAVAAGFDSESTLTFAGGQSAIRIDDEELTLNAETTSSGGSYGVTFGEKGLSYAINVIGMTLLSQGGELPFPVEMAFGEASFNLAFPLLSSDVEQDFSFGLTLGDFTVSDLLWSLVDPSAQLPRDPATFALDLSGKARLFLDLLDPEQMIAVEDEGAVPGELNSVSLDQLRLSLAGAELTGKGAFVFDNDDLETFDGMPAPDGAVDLSLVGGNGLLDKLIAMGLVPEDQAMGVRMMMGLFAVPGEGEDTLQSKIQVTPDGQVLANGQRLR